MCVCVCVVCVCVYMCGRVYVGVGVGVCVVCVWVWVCVCVCVWLISGTLIAANSVKRLIARIDNNSEDSIFINCGQEKERWTVVSGFGIVRHTIVRNVC